VGSGIDRSPGIVRRASLSPVRVSLWSSKRPFRLTLINRRRHRARATGLLLSAQRDLDLAVRCPAPRPLCSATRRAIHDRRCPTKVYIGITLMSGPLDANPIPGANHGALDHRLDVQLSGDLWTELRAALELHRRCPRDDAETLGSSRAAR